MDEPPKQCGAKHPRYENVGPCQIYGDHLPTVFPHRGIAALILEETHALVYKQGAKQIDLPINRLDEFLISATRHRFFTPEQLEEFRQVCLRGEARAWGVPVRFIVPPWEPLETTIVPPEF